jgi:chemotaxis protein CheX
MFETESDTLACIEGIFSVRNQELIDETVTEVFGMMLGFGMRLVPPSTTLPSTSDQSERTAIVGFSGCMRGSCGIRVTALAARAIASAMLGGIAFDEEDGSIDDAVGELCNMLAGGWKNRVRELSSNCLLSTPAVISGSDYRVHIRTASTTVSRTYTFESYTLQMTLVCDQHVTS